MRVAASVETRSDSFGVLGKISLRTGGLTCIMTIQTLGRRGPAYFTFAKRVGDGPLRQKSWLLSGTLKRVGSASLSRSDSE